MLGAPSPTQNLKRRVYLIISGFSVLTSLVGLSVYLFVVENTVHPLVIAVLGLSVAYHAFVATALVAGYLRTRQIETPLIIMTAVVIFTLLGQALYSDYPSQQAEITTMSMYLWLPLLYLFSFLAMEARRALVLSVGLLGAIMAFLFPHALRTAAGSAALDGFSLVGNIGLSHSVIITGLYFLATFQRRLQRAVGEANHMQRLAYTDELTGIANRRQMEQLIHAEMLREQRYGRPFSVVLIDIDRFKVINDSYGHDTGDVVLKRLSDCIASNIRASDRVGRWGGEEFLVLAPETDLEEAVALAEHVRLCVEESRLLEDHPLTISLGVTRFLPQDTGTTLIKRADEALYAAKQAGRNRVMSQARSLDQTQS